MERFIHLSIEEVIDVANHFVSFYQWREPVSFRDLFSILEEHGVIPPHELPRFQNMASVRNVLVHRYESIDDELVFNIFKSFSNFTMTSINDIIAHRCKHPQ